MHWITHLHGWSALGLGWSLVAVPMWVGLWQGRAPLEKWLLSPFTAAILTLIAAFVASALSWALEVNVGVPAKSTTAVIASMMCFVLVGYLGGRLRARSAPGEVHKRGSLLEEGKRAHHKSGRVTKIGGDLLTLAGIAISPEDETKHFKMIGT